MVSPNTIETQYPYPNTQYPVLNTQFSSQTPFYLPHPIFPKKFIGFAKMPAADETAMSRQGTGMGRIKLQVARVGNNRRFLLRIGSPKHKYKILFLLIQGFDHRIGEQFP